MNGIIILAAGSSSRLGEPKQLLKFRGQTLILHITSVALEVCPATVVVTGANAELVEKELIRLPCKVVYNADWELGMASSIVTGLTELKNTFTDIEGVFILVSDQPFVTSSLLSELLQTMKSQKKGIAACSYLYTAGTPVFFSSQYFDQLLTLTGADGAKKLLKRYSEDVVTVSFPEGNIDIDTQLDYTNLLNRES